MKTYIGIAVWLRDVPLEHVSANGNKQFDILLRTSSKKRAAEILKTTLYSLNYFGFHEAPDTIGYGKAEQAVSDIVKKNHTVYYKHRQQWFELGGAK